MVEPKSRLSCHTGLAAMLQSTTRSSCKSDSHSYVVLCRMARESVTASVSVTVFPVVEDAGRGSFLIQHPPDFVHAAWWRRSLQR